MRIICTSVRMQCSFFATVNAVMKPVSFILATLLLGLVCASSDEKVLLMDVTSFLAELGRMTTSRKSERVPQLKCDGGNAGCGYSIQPRAVNCVNLASHSTTKGASDIRWECRPVKPLRNSQLMMTNIRVSCEGYDSQDDHHVLRGSCGVEYEFNVTDVSGDSVTQYYSRHYGFREWEWDSIVALILLFIMAVWMVYGVYFGSTAIGNGDSSKRPN